MNINLTFNIAIENLCCLYDVFFEDGISKSQAIVPFVAARKEHAFFVILLYQYT
jgi:hypothetical protein